MKSDRFKKPATLSRYARQIGGPALEMASEAGLPLIDCTQNAACFDLKTLQRAIGTEGDWHALFHDIVEELQESPLAASLLRRAMKKGWALGLATADAKDSDYFYTLDMGQQIIWLDHGGFCASAIRRAAHCRDALTGSLLRALRDIGHEMRLGAYERSLRPDAVLMMERARSADIEAVTTMIAWELRGAGYPGLWRHLLGSEEGDIALTFGYTIEKNPKSLFDGKALAATFLRWFADKMRLNACDHNTLEMLDGLMEQHSADEGWGKLSFTAEDARDLSILPDGFAYLKDEAKALVSAPEYHVVPDAINEAHLFQISHDVAVVRVAGVPFRSAALAKLIFPTAR